MKKIQFLFTVIPMLIFNIIFAQRNETIFFEKNDFKLSNQEKQKIDNFLNNLTLKENEVIEIKGFTDSDGNSDLNMKLSENRVRSIEAFLLSQNIKPEKIKLSFYGENYPVASNLEEEGKQKNRRVEIRVFSPSENNLNIYTRFKNKPQIFIVSAKENIEIKGEEGTIIRIPKYALVNSKERTITGEVEISLEEYYKNSDIIKANLHTLSDGKILETGGMINLVIHHKNEELKLKQGQEIEIEFATNDMDRMQTFIGETKNGKFNWKVENISEPQTSKVNLVEFDTIANDTISLGRTFQKNSSQPKIKRKTVTSKVLTSRSLRWINCDRFLNSDKESTHLKVETNLEKVDLKIIFKDINSIMTPDRPNEFSYIPILSKVTLVGFKEINGEIFYASKEITIEKDHTETLTLTKISVEKLDEELKKLDLIQTERKIGEIWIE